MSAMLLKWNNCSLDRDRVTVLRILDQAKHTQTQNINELTERCGSGNGTNMFADLFEMQIAEIFISGLILLLSINYLPNQTKQDTYLDKADINYYYY